jgi:translation initiation factor IF-3
VLGFAEATTRGVKALADDASDQTVLIGDNGQPVVAVVDYEKYEAQQQEARELAVATGRVLTKDTRKYTFDEVLQQFSIEDDDLVRPMDDLRKYQD